MCGRFYKFKNMRFMARLFLEGEALELALQMIDEMEAEERDDYFRENGNVRPTQKVMTFVGNEEAEVEPRLFKWGHAPARYKSKQPLFNARGETLEDKPTWVDSWYMQRCLIPADGFYEWTGPKTARQPNAVQNADGSPMLFGGLWREDDGVAWCSIVTCEPSEWFSQYHNREPVIVRGEDWQRWLFDADPPDDLLHPSEPDDLEVFACTKPAEDKLPTPAKTGLFG